MDYFCGVLEQTAQATRRGEAGSWSNSRGAICTGAGNNYKGAWDEDVNLHEVFRRMDAAHQAVEEAIQIIDELDLPSGGWQIRWSPKGPYLDPTTKTGRRKSGPNRRDSWSSCGAGLVHYLRERTGSPRYARVCRLLAAAGEIDFTNGEQNEVDLLRKGIERLNGDQAAMSGVLARLLDCERAFEALEPTALAEDARSTPPRRRRVGCGSGNKKRETRIITSIPAAIGIRITLAGREMTSGLFVLVPGGNGLGRRTNTRRKTHREWVLNAIDAVALDAATQSIVLLSRWAARRALRIASERAGETGAGRNRPRNKQLRSTKRGERT